MARKNRYGGKKRGGKKKGRKAAGRRLARYNKLAARVGKRAAHAQVFGRGPGRKKGKRRGGGGGGRKRRGIVSSLRRRMETKALHDIKEKYGTRDMKATPAEIRLAQIAVSRALGRPDPRRGRYGSVSVSVEDRIRHDAAQSIARTKRAAAARLVTIKLRQRQAEELANKRRAAVEEAQRAIDAEAARIG